MEFKKDKDDSDFISDLLTAKTTVNIINKEDFEERITRVFGILCAKLARSFGPWGAGTFVSIYPKYYNTKDGYSIMKNIAFDNKLDQVICDMVSDVCNRLNFTVGDGTTTAVVATRSIYEAYRTRSETVSKNVMIPREVMKGLSIIKDKLLEMLSEEAIPIRSDDPEELEKCIRAVVYISSNANEELTDMIGNLYRELQYPAISIVNSGDGTLKSYVTTGYKLDAILTDKLYINNDNQTMKLRDVDIIVFDHKVTSDTYEYILQPLSEACKARGRHLVCLAPYYDDVALEGTIGRALNAEYKATHDINLVLMVFSKVNAVAKTAMSDFAMLVDTTMITSSMERQLIEKLRETNQIYHYFDIDNRGIEGINVCIEKEEYKLAVVPYTAGLEHVFNILDNDLSVRVGYCETAELGLKESTFDGFHYDDAYYKKYMDEAMDAVKTLRKQCEANAVRSDLLQDAQRRLNALGLRYGVIEVGAMTDVAETYLRDTVDDAVKAAASAFTNGIVFGCNVTTLRCIKRMMDTCADVKTNNEYTLLSILFAGFKDVYKTVLSNAFEDRPVNIEVDGVRNITNDFYHNFVDAMRKYTPFRNFTVDPKMFKEAYPQLQLDSTIHDVIVEISLKNEMVFDVSTGEFTDMIINSAETDKEILKATVDLLSLLITGNQLVIR